MTEANGPSVLRVNLDGLGGNVSGPRPDASRIREIAADLLSAEREQVLRAGSGFCEFETRAAEWIRDMEVVRKELGEDWDSLLVLGVGGSSLGGRTLVEALGKRGSPRVVFVDNADPHTLEQELLSLDPARTVVNVISKSGHTMETIACFALVLEWLKGSVTPSLLRRRIVVTTEAGEGALARWAATEGWSLLPVPEDVGGRYSVLTPVGLFPALVAGVDIQELLDGASRQEDMEGRREAARLAAALVELDRGARCGSLVLWIYGDPLLPLGAWLIQLLGESLGKIDDQGERRGMVPVLARGSTDQHSQLQLHMDGPEDKAFLFVSVDALEAAQPIRLPDFVSDRLAYLRGRTLGEVQAACCEATLRALSEAGKPCGRVSLPQRNAQSLGAVLQLLMRATALAGIGLGINPFDQPGVEAGKRQAIQLLTALGGGAHGG